MTPKTWKDVEVAFKSKFIRDDGLMSKYYYGENEEEVTTGEAIISFLRTAIQQAFEAVMPKNPYPDDVFVSEKWEKIKFGWKVYDIEYRENIKKFFGDDTKTGN